MTEKKVDERTKSPYVVEVRHLTKKYKELIALNDLSLAVKEGEIFGLLGPNGSGKTTLTHCMLALLHYDQGEIDLFGKAMGSNAVEIKKKIGFVPQEVAVNRDLTVLENIDYFCGLYISDPKKRRQGVEEAIAFTQLGDFRKFLPKKLSGGLLRRLNLACGIAHHPQLIFLDEPTVAVDPQSRNNILEGIQELRKQGVTIIYTTHYMEEVERLCDRLVILDHGQIISQGTTAEILAQTKLGENIQVKSYQIEAATVEYLQGLEQVLSVHYDEAAGLLTLQMCGGQDGGSQLLEILHELEKMGVEPLSISSQQPNLNDVFLEITGKELRDHA